MFWIMPLIRILLCALVFDYAGTLLRMDSANIVLLTLSYIWIAWTVATLIGAFAGQPLNVALCRFVVTGDSLLAIVTMVLVKGHEGATIAFALSVVIYALSLRVGKRAVFFTVMIAPFAFILRDGAALLGFAIPKPDAPSSLTAELITAVLQILAIAMLILWANRRYLIEKFSNDFSSLKMLSPERSFEFDLQTWIQGYADLFVPQRAACLMAAPAKNATNRYFHKNLQALDLANDQESLLAAFKTLPAGCSIFDCELNQIVSAGDRLARPFDESEKRLAVMLHKANISAAMLQPLHIDRSRGGVICAVQRPVDAALIAEAFHLGQHVSEMADFLGRIAMAERNFIADAHDVARRDLHDGVLQSLAALRMRLLTIAKRKDIAGGPAQLEIRKSVDILTLEQARLRGLLDVSQSETQTVNLVTQLDICMRGISLQWDIDAKLVSEEPAIPIDPESAINIEHLLREVVANAVRHANSKSLTASLSLKQDALMMVVNDRGHISTGGTGGTKASLTLQSASLRHRLRLVGGEAYVEGLEQGVLLAIRIPMQQVDDA